MTTPSLEGELDAAHSRAHAAYARLDGATYMSLFHPDLEYTQADGQTIGHYRLASQVRTQLARVHRASTEYHRETLEANGANRAVEVLEQHATYEVRAFVFLRREWAVNRRGRFEWVRSDDGWRIRRVKVLSEKITSRAWLGRS